MTDTASLAEFEVYEDSEGGWRWRLVATNGQIIADSAESYTTKESAIAGSNAAREAAPTATVAFADTEPEPES